jgi:hypothetical protein
MTHRLLIPVLAASAFLVAALIAAAPASAREPQPAWIEMDIPANNGLRAHVETSSEGITLDFRRKGRLVSYRVQGEATELGLKAQFGQLGRIDVAFEPTEMHTEKPPKGCSGPPSRWGDGFFVGAIEFTGEREYVRIDASRAKGTMDVSRESDWRCSANPRSMRQLGAPQFPTPPRRERSEAGAEDAALSAIDAQCQCYFVAFAIPDRKHRPRSFYGARFEDREGMEITRTTSADGGASTFVFNHSTGTATVRPPGPISGHATFMRRPNARDLWTSTIQVPLLGADPLSIRGDGYRARLVRALPGD